MNPRRIVLGAAAAFLLIGIAAAPVGAGVAAPRDLIASPNTGPVGTHVTISNAANSPCGGQEGDGPASVDVLVTKPDGTDANVSIDVGESGDWELVYFATDQVGTYLVDGQCIDESDGDQVANATGFDYTETSFEITAAEVSTTTTAEPTTSSTAAPAAAVAATAAFTG